MRRIIVFFIMLVILIFSYVNKNINNNMDVDNNSINEDIKVDILYNDEVIQINMEDYVIGVVACEMPASFDIEALKSLSVASRTFALYKMSTNKNYVMKTNTTDQCYIDRDEMKNKWGNNYDKYYSKIYDAVNMTKGQYMTYNDDIIISFYFSISNGYTENCENVFSQKLDYLRSVESIWDKKYNFKENVVKIKVLDFLDKLKIKNNKINEIIINKSNTGRASEIIVNNIKFKGTNFRRLLNLRSTDIEINYDRQFVYIKTKGYGHGVGLSQYGANGMALNGYKYDEILKYYYSGIEIMNK